MELRVKDLSGSQVPQLKSKVTELSSSELCLSFATVSAVADIVDYCTCTLFRDGFKTHLFIHAYA